MAVRHSGRTDTFLSVGCSLQSIHIVRTELACRKVTQITCKLKLVYTFSFLFNPALAPGHVNSCFLVENSSMKVSIIYAASSRLIVGIPLCGVCFQKCPAWLLYPFFLHIVSWSEICQGGYPCFGYLPKAHSHKGTRSYNLNELSLKIKYVAGR